MVIALRQWHLIGGDSEASISARRRVSTLAGSICIAAIDLAYVVRNGGIGTYNWLLAHTLASSGWKVHVLYCGPVEDPLMQADIPHRLAQAGIGFSNLDGFPTPQNLKLVSPREPEYVFHSDRVRNAIEELHRRHHFDLIEFADWKGVGFRTVQARMSGQAFQDVRIIVKLHSPSQWLREGNLCWMERGDNLRLDFCERYSFENADLQLSPSQYMLDYVRSVGWNARSDARVVPNPFPKPIACHPRVMSPKVREIVFFGRLETRKGLEVFLEAVKDLDPSIRLSFLGKEAQLVCGPMASKYVRSQLKGRKTSLLTSLNHEQAIAYLAQGGRLAVIPSILDNFPYSVIECAVNRIPFLASSVGGVPEIISDPELQDNLLFLPNSRDLRRCLERYLQNDSSWCTALRAKAQETVDIEATNRWMVQAYSQMLSPQGVQSTSTAPGKAIDPLVTVCVTFYNLGDCLPETLASLVAQTYRNAEVLVVDDGSTDPNSIRVFEEQERLYPQFRFLRQQNTGPCAARNRGMAEARGEYFIPVDADNIATPQMVERFVVGIRRRPDLAALASYYLAFKQTADIARSEFCYAFRPVGGSQVMGSLWNVYGDVNSIYRLSDFRAVGGFEAAQGMEDWEVFAKLVNRGYNVDVLPDYLFYYRHREGSVFRTMDTYSNYKSVLRQYYKGEHLSKAERIALWTALVSLHLHLEQHQHDALLLRYRLMDNLNASLERFPSIYRFSRRLALFSWQSWQRSASVWNAWKRRLSSRESGLLSLKRRHPGGISSLQSETRRYGRA